MARNNRAESTESVTFRISVPKADTDVISWLSRQYSMSLSIRQLIKQAVGEYGMRDLFCIPVDEMEAKRGRPRKDGADILPRVPSEVIDAVRAHEDARKAQAEEPAGATAKGEKPAPMPDVSNMATATPEPQIAVDSGESEAPQAPDNRSEGEKAASDALSKMLSAGLMV